MEDKEQIADMLMKNGLAPTREHAIMLAEKFQAMDNNSSNLEYTESNVSISGNNSYMVSYEEEVMMQVSAPSFAEALLHSTSPPQNIPKQEIRQEPQQRDRSIPGAQDQTEAQRRLQETKVDITEFFNVNNMKKK